MKQLYLDTRQVSFSFASTEILGVAIKMSVIMVSDKCVVYFYPCKIMFLNLIQWVCTVLITVLLPLTLQNINKLCLHLITLFEKGESEFMSVFLVFL